MAPALVVAILAMCVSVAAVVVTGLVLKKYREETRDRQEALEGVRNEWEAFSTQSQEVSKRVTEKLGQVEADAHDRMERLDQATSDLDRRLALFHDDAVDTRERLNRVNEILAETQGELERFEQYTKDFLERELSQSFVKFDQTVGTVLGEMKNELLRGVERIDQIQSVVETKTDAEKRLFGGESGFKLLGEATDEPFESARAPEPKGGLALEETEDEEDEEDIVQPGFMEPTEVCETTAGDLEAEPPQEPVGEQLGAEAEAPVETPREQAPEPPVGPAFDEDEEETVDLRPSEGEEPTQDVPEAAETGRIETEEEEAGDEGEGPGEEAPPFEPAPAAAEGLARPMAATPARGASGARVRLPGALGESRPPRGPLARSGPAALRGLLQRRGRRGA